MKINKVFNKALLLLILTLTVSFGTLSAQTINQAGALSDIHDFKQILEKHSSYLNKTGFDYDSQISSLIDDVQKQEIVDIEYLRNRLERITAQIGDRHSSVKYNNRAKEERKYRFLPFIAAPLNNKVIALQKGDNNQYRILYKKYPYLKSINSIPIDSILSAARPTDIKAPQNAKFYRQVKELRNIEEIFEKGLRIKLEENVQFIFSGSEKDTIITMPLPNRRKSWNDMGDISERYEDEMESKDYYSLFQWKGNIAYMAIPEMTHKKGFHKAIQKQMLNFKPSDALIIDIRGNGGGTRDILMALAPYFFAPNQKPWVANVAYVRTDNNDFSDKLSMKGRYLYTYNSRKHTDTDRKAISEFMRGFEPKWKFDTVNFSQPFFMVLQHNEKVYNYNKPVYILMNEQCFSAASVFAAAFKGLPNIKLVGQTTDGSSGKAKYFTLSNSKIRIKLSTMISFQRNGKTLDGNGTEPDIKIIPDLGYVLNKKDNQLSELIQIINSQ